MALDSGFQAAVALSLDVCLTSDIGEDEKGDTGPTFTVVDVPPKSPPRFDSDLMKLTFGAIQPIDARIPGLVSQAISRGRITGLDDYAISRGRMWPIGATLRVRFMISPAFPAFAAVIGQAVLAIAKEWETHANIEFQLVDAEPSHIRVSLNVGAGSQSAVGIMALHPGKKDKPTMNLDILGEGVTPAMAQRTILHEFGHVLGLMHEHQRSDSGIPWDEAKVLDHYKKLKPTWSDKEILENVFNFVKPSHSSAFDKDSIMMYDVPADVTGNGVGYPLPLVLSEMDKKFIGLMYPNFD